MVSCLAAELTSVYPQLEGGGQRAGALQLLALWIDHKGKCFLPENASVCILVKINYHILNYNTIV